MMNVMQEDSALLQHWAQEGLERLGLVWDVKVPDEQQLAQDLQVEAQEVDRLCHAVTSALELDRRKIRDRIAELQKELDAMGAGRSTQRARRQERQGLARVALVGGMPSADGETYFAADASSAPAGTALLPWDGPEVRIVEHPAHGGNVDPGPPRDHERRQVAGAK